MKKLLVTGASGFLGWNVCQAAQANWQVYGTYATHPVTISGVTTLKVDLTDYRALQELFQSLQPDAVIHLAAQSSPNVCQTQPEAAYAINVTASANLAGLSGDRAIPCVFTSSDLVFDGRNAPYTETDPVCPISHYGEQKVLAEQEMRSRHPGVAVCRMPLMFGYAPNAVSFLQPFLQTMRSGKPLSLFVDEVRTPVSGRDAAQGLLLALEQVQGYLHLGGCDRLSRYEFGRHMVEVLELTEANISACRQADVPMPAPRPADVSLDSSKAFELGYNPGSIREELAFLRDVL
ncbi:NAD(P)-dependent oxidoreductase [Oscillatoria sp. FACHB-1407]|uniref:SDR family oxidoreductase n=1 Tax=Oscillatoria sp. FACHB-1407 TaxID=2692847 RepID=UPI0016868678|nr:NAD(P)-dependent oxidoreductase [Oscillatoria sp. FACHB-1407]MBD2461736.1 NAD(P)-dependent oxidoreductase [Oscillatoria sp. FACHB-1407]